MYLSSHMYVIYNQFFDRTRGSWKGVVNGLLREARKKVVQNMNNRSCILQQELLFQSKMILHLYPSLSLHQNRLNWRYPRTLMRTYRLLVTSTRVFAKQYRWTEGVTTKSMQLLRILFLRRIRHGPLLSVWSSAVGLLQLKSSEMKVSESYWIGHQQSNDSFRIHLVHTIFRLFCQIPLTTFFPSKITVLVPYRALSKKCSKCLSVGLPISQMFSLFKWNFRKQRDGTWGAGCTETS